VSGTSLNESVFWQDLRDDMANPAFAREYVRTSEELAGAQVAAAVLEAANERGELTIFEVAEDGVLEAVGALGEFSVELIRMCFPEASEEWVLSQGADMARSVEEALAEEFGERALERPGVRQIFGGWTNVLRRLPYEEEQLGVVAEGLND
jgi:hypothetical protein